VFSVVLPVAGFLDAGSTPLTAAGMERPIEWLNSGLEKFQYAAAKMSRWHDVRMAARSRRVSVCWASTAAETGRRTRLWASMAGQG